jgi:hypothetical protein
MRVVLFVRQFGRDMADGLRSVAWQIRHNPEVKPLLLFCATLAAIAAFVTVLNQ